VLGAKFSGELHGRRNDQDYFGLAHCSRKSRRDQRLQSAGDKLGTVDDIMLDKVSGKAIYALMSFGGFLGIGEKYHPLPWSSLKYDESKGGYIVNLDKRMLENAPTYDMNEDFRWTPDYGRQVDKYYDAPSYW
jgi:hypothetical protein